MPYLTLQIFRPNPTIFPSSEFKRWEKRTGGKTVCFPGSTFTGMKGKTPAWPEQHVFI